MQLLIPAAPIKDDKGNITGAVLVFRDITERKRAEEARRKQIGQERLVAEMEKINQLKDEFLISPSPIPSTIFTISNSVEIPAAELPHLLYKFYRIPNGDLWQQGGTGLGLALVQNLVQQLQANIQVESREGWTTFTVQLPTNAIASDN